MRNRFALALLLISSQAMSTVVIDQLLPAFYGSAASLAIGGEYEQKIAQTFKAGLSGTLDHVSLVLSCATDSPGLLSVEIQGVDALGVPDGTVLGSTSVASSTLFLEPIFFQDISISGVTLTADDDYAIVIRADSKAQCATRAGPCLGCFFSYLRGGGFSAALPSPDAWVPFDPISAPDIPFYTWMRVPDPRGPLFCEFRDASGIPNDWLPNHVPLCGCLSDPILRSNRCWFALPDFMLWREMPLPWENPKGKAVWSALPMVSGFAGLSVFESRPNNGFFVEEVQFKAGLKSGNVHQQKVKYAGVTDRTEVEILFKGPTGAASVRFETFLSNPDNPGQ